LKSRIFQIVIVTVCIIGFIGSLLALYQMGQRLNDYERMSQVSSQTPVVTEKTAIFILQNKSSGELRPMMEVPTSVKLRLESLPTPTPTPEPTQTETPTPEPTQNIIEESKHLRGEGGALTYQIATVQPIEVASNSQNVRIGVQSVDLPDTTQEIWLAGKQILIDVGLWYPIQSAMSFILIVIIVVIILGWIKP
jgi:hypothetical protein